MGWLVCGLSSARPVMRGPVVGTLYKESSSPSQTLRTHFYHIRFSLIRFLERSDRHSHKASFNKGCLGEDLEILRSVLFTALHRFRIKEDINGFQIWYVILVFLSIKMMFVFYHGDLGC